MPINYELQCFVDDILMLIMKNLNFINFCFERKKFIILFSLQMESSLKKAIIRIDG